MKLKQFSLWFSLLVISALSANALFLLMIQQAYNSVVAVQAHRQRAMLLASELRQETEQLTQLVRAYTSTGQTKYLTFYYDILAIRQGEKPQPEHYIPGAYWDMAIAGAIPYQFPLNGERRSITERMKSLGFSSNEFLSLARVTNATEAMKQIEQVAFAATQGLYDTRSQKFVSDGKPNLRFASQLVHSSKYNQLKSNLAQSTMGLITMVDERTNLAVGKATKDLERWIYATLCSVLFTFAMVLVAFRVTQRRVLQPIERLSQAASRLAQGDYSTRSGPLAIKPAAAPSAGLPGEPGSSNWVAELMAFSTTFDGMAESIEQDIRLRQEVQGELEAANRKAEEATRAKSMFLANMSHEIRTPMNAIIGMAYLALKTDLTVCQRDYLEKVHNASKSLLGIINDILDFSKIEAGKLKLEQALFRLEDVVGNSLTMLRQPAHEKEIELLLDLSDPQVLAVSNALVGDSLRLGQVVTNLLSNAVKFTHQGYVKLAIRVESQDAHSVCLRFSVEDTGIGMTGEQIGNLFREFTQADGTTTRLYGGTGLGLTISKKLVEAMGGRIWVESSVGTGTCFSFNACFPLSGSARAPTYLRAGQERMRVLVVDDHCEARQVLCGQLKALGVGAQSEGVAEAVGCEQALVMLRAAEQQGKPYDLLLLDWLLPVMDGAQLLRLLPQAGLSAPPTVAVVTAYDTDAVRQAARNLSHCSIFLAKPVLPEMLRNLLRELAGEAAQGSGSEPPAKRGAELAGMRVLLAEDNLINRQLAVELLRLRGVAVVVAVNGQLALESLAARPDDHFDLVLMDLQMPVMDGFEATRRLRSDRRYDALPIVAMSAHAMAEERERCRSKGMQDHICKPIEPELLYATLARFYRGARGAEPAHPVSVPYPSMPAQERAPRIAGLDTADGLRRAGNKSELYLWLLKKFAAEFGEAPARTEEEVVAGQWEEAERLIHTLQGLLGSIGATELQQRAGVLQQTLQNRDAAWKEELARFSTAFDPLIRALWKWFPDAAPPEEDEIPTVAAAAPPSWFAEFEALLGDGDYQAAVLWEARHPELKSVIPERTIRRISRALENFDYPLAKSLAESAADCTAERRGETS